LFLAFSKDFSECFPVLSGVSADEFAKIFVCV